MSAGLWLPAWAARHPAATRRTARPIRPRHEAGTITRDDASRTAAFQEYVQPELDVLYRVALRLTRNQHDAEDLVQDTLVRAYRALDRFDGRYPRAWLLTILRNTNINRARKKRPLSGLEDYEFGTAEPAWQLPDRGDTVEDAALGRVPNSIVADAVNGLSQKLKDVVVLVDVDDLTYKEAAEVLDVPVGTIMSRLHRARKRIRQSLEEAGGLDIVVPDSTLARRHAEEVR